MWKRCGSGKPQQSAAEVRGLSLGKRPEPQTAVDGEVARSSRAPPILLTEPAFWEQRLDNCLSRKAALSLTTKRTPAVRPKQASGLVAGLGPPAIALDTWVRP